VTDNLDRGLDALIALNILSDVERELYIDHVIVGRTYNQLAETHGMKHSAIRESVRRSTVKLRRYLSEREAA